MHANKRYITLIRVIHISAVSVTCSHFNSTMWYMLRKRLHRSSDLFFVQNITHKENCTSTSETNRPLYTQPKTVQLCRQTFSVPAKRCASKQRYRKVLILNKYILDLGERILSVSPKTKTKLTVGAQLKEKRRGKKERQQNARKD